MKSNLVGIVPLAVIIIALAFGGCVDALGIIAQGRATQYPPIYLPTHTPTATPDESIPCGNRRAEQVVPRDAPWHEGADHWLGLAIQGQAARLVAPADFEKSAWDPTPYGWDKGQDLVYFFLRREDWSQAVWTTQDVWGPLQTVYYWGCAEPQYSFVSNNGGEWWLKGVEIVDIQVYDPK